MTEHTTVVVALPSNSRSSTLRAAYVYGCRDSQRAADTGLWRRDRIFFTALPVLMTAVVFGGFAPTYIAACRRRDGLR